MALKPPSTLLASRSPIVDKNGNAMPFFSKLLQGWDTELRNLFNQVGELTGIIAADAIIAGRSEGIGTTVGHIDDTGQALAPMVDFARPYLNKNTDHINDGTGSPLSGGATAQEALNLTAPVAGDFLEYDGTDWVPGHPAFTSISGQVTPGQLPASGVLPGTYANATVTVDATGRVTNAVAGAGITVVEVTAALTLAGTQGSMTFVNGILTAQVQAT